MYRSKWESRSVPRQAERLFDAGTGRREAPRGRHLAAAFRRLRWLWIQSRRTCWGGQPGAGLGHVWNVVTSWRQLGAPRLTLSFRRYLQWRNCFTVLFGIICYPFSGKLLFEMRFDIWRAPWNNRIYWYISFFSTDHAIVFCFRCSVYWWKGSVRF